MLAGIGVSLSWAGDGGGEEPKRRKMVNAIDNKKQIKSSGRRFGIMTASKLPGKGHGRMLQSRNIYRGETLKGASVLTTDMGSDFFLSCNIFLGLLLATIDS